MSSFEHKSKGENFVRDQYSRAPISRDRTEEVPQVASEEVTSSGWDQSSSQGSDSLPFIENYLGPLHKRFELSETDI